MGAIDLALKKKLYELCVSFVEERIQTAQSAIDNAQEAANNESKSSAGDKHETGRAMMQLETEKNSKQLNEALRLREVVSRLNPHEEFATIQLGSLIKTSIGIFYISIGVGKITLEDQVYLLVSPGSLIGQKLNGLNVGDSFVLNDQEVNVIEMS